MTGEGELSGLLAADRETLGLVLQNCRLHVAGRHPFGREAISEELHRAGFGAADVTELSSSTCAVTVHALEGRSPIALFADMHQGRFTQLWLMSDHVPSSATPPRVAVPSDPDCDQRGAGPIIVADEHPALRTEHAEAITRAWEGFAPSFYNRPPPLTRIRAVVLRALSRNDGWGALLRLSAACEGKRLGWFAVMVSGSGGDEPALIEDSAGFAAALAEPWTASLRP
jgi:hypothetical protein